MVAWDAAYRFTAGDWSQAEGLLRVALGKRPGHLAEIRVRLTASHLALRKGRYAEAEAHLARADELTAADSALPFMNIDEVRVELAVARGDFERGVAHALDTLAAVGGPLGPHNIEAVIPLAVRAFASMAEAARDSGDDPAPVLARLQAFRREHPDVIGEYWVTGDKEGWYDAALRMHRAMLAAEESRAGQAPDEEIRWQHAAAACVVAERRWEEAYCRWREAEAWARRPARSRTETALPAAHRQAAELGAQPLVDSLVALARSARIPLTEAVRPDTGDVPALPGLTNREREILAHVMAGSTYPEIARTLVLSEKTVAVHVSNMLRKTGTANRVELAQLARRVRATAQHDPGAGARSSGPRDRRR
jgi:DNA-binding NarL/FixJ family response regulator